MEVVEAERLEIQTDPQLKNWLIKIFEVEMSVQFCLIGRQSRKLI